MITDLQLQAFQRNSVIQLNNLIDPSFCSNVREYFLENENKMIDLYAESRRGLVVEQIHGKTYIKYFEYPLHFSSMVFGSLLTSEIFSLGQQILGQPVRYVSSEIHSRHAGASGIPPHQDNAYYGLSRGDALTFYISLDSQSPSSGGLQYISNPIDQEHEHIGSGLAAFSLALRNPQSFSDRKIIQPIYQPGDCTIHHSRSIHFADCASIDSERALVFRVTLYSSEDVVKPSHSKWYEKMIASNRAERSF